jgi:hypothetical protein
MKMPAYFVESFYRKSGTLAIILIRRIGYKMWFYMGHHVKEFTWRTLWQQFGVPWDVQVKLVAGFMAPNKIPTSRHEVAIIKHFHASRVAAYCITII